MYVLYIYLSIYTMLPREKWVYLINIRINGHSATNLSVYTLGMPKCWGFNYPRNFIRLITQPLKLGSNKKIDRTMKKMKKRQTNF